LLEADRGLVTEDALAAARSAFARRDWAAARAGFRSAQARAALSADDLDALAAAAWWLGLPDEAISVGEESYQRYLADSQPRRAAMAAMGIAVNHFLRGEESVGSGWMSHAFGGANPDG